jgi:hypothetical protein
MVKATPFKVLLLDEGGTRMDQTLNDGLLIFGFLAIVLAPMALALAQTGPGGAGWKLLTFGLLCLRWMVLYLPFKSAHCACDLASSVGMRDGHANAARFLT